MLRVQYASKLFVDKVRCKFTDILIPSAPILALCGDIGNTSQQRTCEFIQWASKRWDKVLWIPGIEEWASCETMIDSINNMRNVASYVENCSVLEKGFCDYIEDGRSKAVFLGTTLWGTCFPGEGILHEQRNIKVHIPGNYGATCIMPNDITMMNTESVKWIGNMLDDLRQEDYKRPVIVLTYHRPSTDFMCIADMEDKSIRTRIHNCLDNIIQHPIQAWLAGDSYGSISAMNRSGTIFFGTNTRGVDVRKSYVNSFYTTIDISGEKGRWYPNVKREEIY